MSDDIDTAPELTADDARRAALLAQVNAGAAPTRPTNPYALAIGWIAAILMSVGVLILLIAVSAAPDQPDGVINLAASLTGVGFVAFGLIALLLLLGIHMARWTPPVKPDDAPPA